MFLGNWPRHVLSAALLFALGHTALCFAFFPVYAAEGDLPYAQEAEERKGIWRGGAPPINKRMSGIDTYYRIKQGAKPNQLAVRLH